MQKTEKRRGGRPKIVLSKAQKDAIFEMLKSGYTKKSITEISGVSYYLIWKYIFAHDTSKQSSISETLSGLS
jgi:hypothetical protein